MTAVVVNKLNREFKTITKRPGIRGALQNFLSPQYKTTNALKNINFSIQEGEFVGLIGYNGAGKTTLLKTISGLIPPTSGSVTVLDENPFDRSIRFRKSIALVMGQKAQLWWDLPAADAFLLIKAIYEIPQKEFMDRLKLFTNMLHLEGLMHTQIRKLSLGERMKMELVGVLLHWPKLVLLDEPTIGLDIIAAQNLREFLKEFNARFGRTILLTSHNMADIERLCQRIIIMNQGEVVYDGAPVANLEANLPSMISGLSTSAAPSGGEK